jgi:hypothetical protein
MTQRGELSLSIIIWRRGVKFLFALGPKNSLGGTACSTSDIRRVNLVTHPVISHEQGKDREVFTTSGTYPWSFVTQIFVKLSK